MSFLKANNSGGASKALPPACRLSKRELAALMTGPKVNIYLGGSRHAELLFSAPRQLLSKFSPTWKAKLAAEPDRPLYLAGSFSKEPVKFLIEWMAAGNTFSTANGAVPYPKGDLVNLICLNRLATLLEVDRLKEETLESIGRLMRNQTLDLKTIDRVARKPDVSPEVLTILNTSLKRTIRGSKNQLWSEDAEGHPGHFQAGLNLLAVLGKEIAQENESRRNAKTSRADTCGANGKGPQNGRSNTSKTSNQAARGARKNAGSQPAPRDSANATGATGGTISQNTGAAKANIVCWNCGQPDHTRPYCSNPRVFLGKCHLCAQQGHRVAECPTRVTDNEGVAKKEPNTRKSKPRRKSQKVRPTTEMTLPPLVATIVFVKDDKTTGKGTAAQSASAPTSPGGSFSSAGAKSKDTPRTSPETTPPPTKSSELKDELPKQTDKPAEPGNTPKVQSRFITRKVRALTITADGSVQREIIPDAESKEDMS